MKFLAKYAIAVCLQRKHRELFVDPWGWRGEALQSDEARTGAVAAVGSL